MVLNSLVFTSHWRIYGTLPSPPPTPSHLILGNKKFTEERKAERAFRKQNKTTPGLDPALPLIKNVNEKNGVAYFLPLFSCLSRQISFYFQKRINIQKGPFLDLIVVHFKQQ